MIRARIPVVFAVESGSSYRSRDSLRPSRAQIGCSDSVFHDRQRQDAPDQDYHSFQSWQSHISVGSIRAAGRVKELSPQEQLRARVVAEFEGSVTVTASCETLRSSPHSSACLTFQKHRSTLEPATASLLPIRLSFSTQSESDVPPSIRPLE